MSAPTEGPAKGPGLDKQKKLALGAVAAVAAGFVYWRRRQAAAAAAAAAPAAGTSAGDTAALGNDAGAGPGVYGATGTAASNTVVGAVSTNQDWYNTALLGAQDAGYDSGTAATALSAYLGHQPLTAAQQTIVRIGLAVAGNPPVGTFTIVTAPPSQVITPPPPSGKVPTNVLNRVFVPVPAKTTWAAEALSTGAFGGNGNALYQYNLLPGKHTATTIAAFRRNGVGTLAAGNLVALPVSGKLINLPGVGTVTT
jgi:hypothetical protein